MFVSDGKLRVNSPKGQLSDGLKTRIAAHRDELIALVGGADTGKLEPIARISRSETLPLSFFQERLWLLHQFQPQSTAYNMTAFWSSDVPLNPSYLEQALSAVLQRHEILRSAFRDQDGFPQLLILPEGEPVQIKDLTALETEEAQRLAIEEDGDEQVHTPFDLKHRPPARFVIYRLPEDRLVTRFVAHHIAVDAWSMALIGREVKAAYDGREPEPATAIQYVDFASWQRDMLESARLKSELEWWERNLKGAPPTSTLPSARSRRAFAPGATRSFRVGLELSNRLRAVTREERATVYMGLVSVCACVLYSYTGQLDLVLGSPMGSRERPEFEQLVGPFVSVLALRIDLAGDPSFAELLARARSAVLDGHAHRDVPFEKLVEHLKPERSFDRTPLFQVAVVLQNGPTLDRIDSGGAIFDLSWFFREVDGELVCGVEYRCDAYDAQMIDAVQARFEHLLRAALDDRRAPLSRLARFPDTPTAITAIRPRAMPAEPLVPESAAALSAEERERLIRLSRRTFRDNTPTTPVIELFDAQVRRTPDARVAFDAAGSMTYAELDRAASVLARRLSQAGVVVGSRVAIGLERSRAVLVAVLAVLRLRAAYVPLDPRYPPDRLAYLFEDAEPAVLITDDFGRDRLPVPPHLPTLSVELAPDPAEAAPLPDVGSYSPDDVVYVMYTSGSTGRPKGVEILNRGLTSLLLDMQQSPGFGPEDRLLSVTTISFDISVVEMFLPLVTGARVYIVARDVLTDGKRLAELAERFDATLLQATPATFRLLLDSDWKGNPKLKIICGGEAMTRELANQLLTRAGSVWNQYGPTETTIWSTKHQVKAEEGPVPIGHAFANTALYVLDPQGALVPEGAVGELYIGGVGVGRGYLKRPELTGARFLPDRFAGGDARMYRTGDAVRFRPDGELDYLGRLDDQVKIRGHRIELGEIESVLREHPGVAAAVVAAREARPGDLRLVGYYVPRNGEVSTRELRELCQTKLTKEMVPSAWMSIAAVPLTPSGKTDRKALPAPVEELVDESSWVPPRDAIEQELVKLWEGVLGVPVPSVLDSFFDLGGHSLLVARLMARIEKSFGVALPYAVILDATTVEKLAKKLREHQAPAKAAAPPVKFSYLVPIRSEGSRPPLFCIHGAGGNVLNLYDVARYLSRDRPFYGIQSAGVDGTSRPKETIEEIASDYLAELRIVQPRGPYYLSGYCGGGLIAYEMAQQLRAAGEQVNLLALIDFYRPGVVVFDRFAGWKRALAEEGPRQLSERLVKKLARDSYHVYRALSVRYHLARSRAIPHELRDFWLTETFMQCAARYKLRPYRGKLTVIRARDTHPIFSEVPPDLGWLSLAQQGIVAVEVPGDHHTLTREPNVRVLAAQLEACVRAADSSDTPQGPPERFDSKQPHQP